MNNEKGLTLTELLAVVALIGIIFIVIFSPITFSLKNFDIQNENTKILSNARTMMDFLIREIRKADKVEITNGHLTLDSIPYKIEDRIFYKNDTKIVEGIDELNIDESLDEENKIKKLEIEIVIKDRSYEDYRLSSTIYLR